MPVVPDMADGRVERVLLRRKDWRRTLIWTMTPHGGCDLFNLWVYHTSGLTTIKLLLVFLITFEINCNLIVKGWIFILLFMTILMIPN